MQRGYLMISAMIVLFVTAALLTLHVERESERSRLDRGEQVGYALSTFGSALGTYIERHRAQLTAPAPAVAGIANALQPTAAELIELLNIRGAAVAPPFIGDASYRFEVSFPASCSSSQKRTDPKCRPLGIAYIDKPLMRGSKIDYVALARAARVMRGQGGYSRPENASHFTFPDGDPASAPIPIVNPTERVGILAWRADTSTGSSSIAGGDDDESLKVNGSNRMKATLRLDGGDEPHDVVGAANIGASGTVTARSLDITGHSVFGEPYIDNGESMRVYGEITAKSDLYVEGSQVIRKSLILSPFTPREESLRSGSIYFGKLYGAGEPCGARQQLAMGPRGALLHCDGAQWSYIPSVSSSGIAASVISLTFGPTESGPISRFIGKWLQCRVYRALQSESPNLRFDTGHDGWYVDVGKHPSSSVEVWCFGKMN